MEAHPQSFQGQNQGLSCQPPRRMTFALLLGGVLLWLMQLLAATPAVAQPGPSYSDAAYGEPGSIDPPGRVGWLSYLEGRVGLGRDGGDDEITSAELNWPISAGDRLLTDRRGRFELRIGSIALRGDDDTEIAIRTLDDERLRLEQFSGTVALSFQSRAQAEGTELLTPYGRVDFALPGDYRIEVRERAGLLVVTTFRGAAYLHADGLSVAVPEGRRAEVHDGGDDYVIRSARTDDFDAWVREREASDDRGRRRANRYVSPEMTGAESLAAYGAWSSVDAYGVVWTPHAQPVGWAPYRHGRWAWVHPWGWTWIDAAPWGFAPFHYGRWVIIQGRWSWVPGSHAHRPVFAPALVVWVGGSNWSFSFSSGPAVGWFPLGPHEVYVPPRHFSHRYAYRVNRPSVSERAIETAVRLSDRPEALREQRFRHRDEPRAVTIVPERTVTVGQAVQRQAIQLRDRREWRSAPIQVAPALQPAAVAERPRRGREERFESRRDRLDETRVETRIEARERAREEGRDGARDEVRDGRGWRDRAEQLAIPAGPPAAAPGRRPEGPGFRDAQRGPGFPDVRERRDGRDGSDGRDGRRGEREESEQREFRPRQPGPPPGAPQVRPLGPISPPAVQPHTPAPIPMPPAVTPPPQPVAPGSFGERAGEQARRLYERDRDAGGAGPRADERREERRAERREERREERRDEPREVRGEDSRQRGAGQRQGGDDEQAQPWRKRVDPRRQEERP